MRPRRLSAAWVLPMSGSPIRDGAVLIGADGRILEVGPGKGVSAPPGAELADHPGAVLIPGLVNTHTHLELSGLGGLAEEQDFPAWIRRIRALKAERTAAEFLAAARSGLAECHAAGVTTVGDTGDSGAVIETLAEAGGSGIAYHEVFGPHPGQVGESMAGLRQRVSELRRFTSARVRLGVSPHAPYTVSGDLYRAVADFAREERLPIAVHLAESAAESTLLGSATGAFAEAWTTRGIPLPVAPWRTPVEWLDQHGVLGRDTLAIHLVRVDAGDLSRLRQRQTAVAHCPLSNRRHGHGAAPIAELLQAGLRVGAGTDSVASVGPLDLLAEARAARALASLSAETAMELVTTGAARALGLDGEVGALKVGLWGDVAAIGVEGGTRERVLEAVLASGPGDVRETTLGGRVVYHR